MESAPVMGLLKETKPDLTKSRLILLFHFPFRKHGGRIGMRSIWFHICSRNDPRHKSIFLLSTLPHPGELLPCAPPRPHSWLHGHRAADSLPERSSCHCRGGREPWRLGRQDLCGSAVSALCSALPERLRWKVSSVPAAWHEKRSQCKSRSFANVCMILGKSPNLYGLRALVCKTRWMLPKVKYNTSLRSQIRWRNAIYITLFLKGAYVSIVKPRRSFSVNILAFNLAFLKCIWPGTAFPVMPINYLDTVRIEAQLQNATHLKPVTCHIYHP